MDTLAVLVAAALSPFLARVLCRRLGLIKPNWRGDRIPAAVGLTFLLFCTVAYTAFPTWPFLITALVFGVLGFWDDWRGDRSVGGFRGHLKALATGRVTTGGVKLLGGGLTAIAVSVLVNGALTWTVPVDAALIALSANTVNLLDLRPGRACFAFALLTAPSVAVGAAQGNPQALTPCFLLVPLALEWPSDARGRVMMGDTGANLLGAVAGLSAVVCLPPAGRVVAAVLLLALNVAAERFSISRTIEETPWLRAIDRRLGVRGSAPKLPPGGGVQ